MTRSRALLLHATVIMACVLALLLPSAALADSDRDGRADANSGATSGEDFDYTRPVPSFLIPTLAVAARDLPVSFRNGCHVSYTEHVFRHCVYGDPAATTRVALFGDSHAEQWLPALIRLAMDRHWRLDTLTRSGCPSADIRSWNQFLHRVDVDCLRFRDSALSWMAKHVPNMVLISNFGRYVPRDPAGRPYPPAKRQTVWKAGLIRTIRALPAASRAIVLADTPYPGIEVPACLLAHRDSIDACVPPKSKAVHSAHAASEREAARTAGATFVSLTDQICPVDRCPVILDQIVLYRDHSHITATYSRALAPSLGAILDASATAQGEVPDVPSRLERGRSVA